MHYNEKVLFDMANKNAYFGEFVCSK